MKIALGGDHAGFQYKGLVKEQLEALGHEVKDFGPFSDASVDYPDFVHPLASAVETKEYEMGILLCGSGNGVAITANKHAGIRAALCWQKELAELSRSHNNANVLCIPARFVSEEVAAEMVDAFLTTPFEGGRHQNRVDKIACA
ncbi:ribose 5-phosphate isomerase B [Rufibacter glacialis]|uniref:Ribose 5-phosphate isomerase B n=1 Tax=Rufibacter glacialis TaxID=1259555 RepID=A0A5M8QS81_9BACT|nr:ribose 5-phosphate isomerase B [Rufibacter glacialis]KAA6438091.1 ribose 5-phosphate isomerase B [Rufibacter glacialis]GGK88459.1 ribose 5-phosphate isomerase B [Rufibacter glacialis]